jgi:hypothetical protein
MFAPPETTGLVGRFGRGMLAAAGSASWFFLAEPAFVGAAVWQRKGFHGLITIVYGPDVRVLGRWYEAAEALYVAWKARHRPEERLDLLCRAANGGYPPIASSASARWSGVGKTCSELLSTGSCRPLQRAAQRLQTRGGRIGRDRAGLLP